MIAEVSGASVRVLSNCGIAVILQDITLSYYYFCLQSVIMSVLLWGLGSTGLFSAPKATTKIEYVSPSVSPVSISSVLLVFPPLNVLFPTPV